MFELCALKFQHGGRVAGPHRVVRLVPELTVCPRPDDDAAVRRGHDGEATRPRVVSLDGGEHAVDEICFLANIPGQVQSHAFIDADGVRLQILASGLRFQQLQWRHGWFRGLAFLPQG